MPRIADVADLGTCRVVADRNELVEQWVVGHIQRARVIGFQACPDVGGGGQHRVQAGAGVALVAGICARQQAGCGRRQIGFIEQLGGYVFVGVEYDTDAGALQAQAGRQQLGVVQLHQVGLEFERARGHPTRGERHALQAPEHGAMVTFARRIWYLVLCPMRSLHAGQPDVDNAHAVAHFVAAAVGHDQAHFMAMGSQRAALLDEDPGVVARMRRRQVDDARHVSSRTRSGCRRPGWR
jgi:hypothetical protein